MVRVQKMMKLQNEKYPVAQANAAYEEMRGQLSELLSKYGSLIEEGAELIRIKTDLLDQLSGWKAKLEMTESDLVAHSVRKRVEEISFEYEEASQELEAHIVEEARVKTEIEFVRFSLRQSKLLNLPLVAVQPSQEIKDIDQLFKL